MQIAQASRHWRSAHWPGPLQTVGAARIGGVAAGAAVAVAAVLVVAGAGPTHRGGAGAIVGPGPPARPARAGAAPAGPGPAGPGPAGLDPAERVASRFASAWWSYDWRDPPEALDRRVRPLVGPHLEHELGSGPGAPVLARAAQAQRRRVLVGAPAVTVADQDGSALGVAVTAEVTVETRGSPTRTARWAMELLVAPVGGRWVVVEMEQ